MLFVLVACQPRPPDGLRILELNIEYGGDVVDFQTVVDAAQAADADVIALEEAWLSTDRLADALGWPNVDHRTDVISRFPVLEPPEAHGMYSLVEVAPGEVVAIGNVHLPSDPYGPYAVVDGAPVADVLALEESTRVPYIAPFLDVLAPLAADGVPTFLTGDFNTPSHLDWTAETVGERPQLVYPVAWPVTVTVEGAGFVDAYRAVHPDPKRDPGLTWWAGRPLVDGYPDHDDPQDRIDLMFAAGPAEALASEVVGERGAKGVDIALPRWGTDHRGVVSTFDATPAPMPVLVTVADRLITPDEEVAVRYHGPGARVVVVPAGEAPAAALAEAPTEGEDGAASFPAGPVGAYDVLLVDGADAVLSRFPFWVTADEGAVLLTTDAAAYASGDPITVSWEGGPGHRWDWLGVYASPADPVSDYFLGYVYTQSEVAGSARIDAHARSITWPLPPGDYTVLYLVNDGYTVAAEASFAVVGATAR